MALYARDLETGKARWVFQLTPDGGTHYREPGELILADISIDGAQVPVVVHFSSNGFVYIINRNTGELLQGRKFDASVNWATAINMDTGRPVRDEDEGAVHDTVCPSPIGAKGDEPAAFSPRTGLFYVPVRHTCMGTRLLNAARDTSLATESQAASQAVPVSSTQAVQQPAPQVETFLLPAGTVLKDGTTNMGMLLAWDGTHAQAAWTVKEPWPVMSGVLATAGDTVFYGTLDGYLKAVDAQTGAPLWQFKLPSGVIGNISTWSYKDKQYIGVLSGSGDTTALLGGDKSLKIPVRPGGTLMVFSLP